VLLDFFSRQIKCSSSERSRTTKFAVPAQACRVVVHRPLTRQPRVLFLLHPLHQIRCLNPARRFARSEATAGAAFSQTLLKSTLTVRISGSIADSVLVLALCLDLPPGRASRCRRIVSASCRETSKNDLSRINGDPSWTVPMPRHYVIGTNGVVAYAEVNRLPPAGPTRSGRWCFQL